MFGPINNRLTLWVYDREMYKKRNEVERLFLCLKDQGEYSQDLKSSMPYLFLIDFPPITDALISANKL